MSFAISDPVGAVLASALDGIAQRQRVIADNIANVDTPGYRATQRRLRDESARRYRLRRHRARRSSPRLLATDTPVGANGNNVDLRKETMAAVQSQFQYQIMTRATSDRFDLLRTVAASDGRLRHPAHRRLVPRRAPDLAGLARVEHRERQHGHAAPTRTAFQAQMLIVRATAGGGVEVAGMALSDPEGRLVSRPGEPAGRRERLRARSRDGPLHPDDPAGDGPARLPGLGAGHQGRPGHLLRSALRSDVR